MSDQEAMREFTRRLFGADAEPEPETPPDPARGNHVPREGANPTPADPDDMHTFTAALFGRALIN